MSRLPAILLWSVIAAAFIGPGTVATAASAGARHGLALLWALVFSTLACFVLQEASGRLTVVSGRSLGQYLGVWQTVGWRRGLIRLLVLGAIVLGCAAYEAGNILGGVAGAMLMLPLPPNVMALLTGGIAAALLWFQAPQSVARSLSVIVAVMGIAFLFTAWRIAPGWPGVLQGSVVPRLPDGAGTLALGLIGTTVVPYNIFLGSGLAQRQRLGDLRLGLAVAIGLGGLISMAVLIVGTAVEGPFGFQGLEAVLSQRLGNWAGVLFATGLLGAGLSSAITAPLAAAVTVRDLLSDGAEAASWSQRSWRYRAVWMLVLATGIGFGISDVEPIPAIIAAQALNGLLLPLVAIFLWVAVNDRRLMGRHKNSRIANVVMVGVVGVSFLLGVYAIGRAATRALDVPPPGVLATVLGAAVFSALLAYPVWRWLGRGRGEKRPG